MPRIGASTTSITLGGMRIPKVPPAVMTPADMEAEYPLLLMVGPAIIPITVTEAPIIPVAAAKRVAVSRTPMYSDPATPPKISWKERKRRSISPAP